MKSGAIVIRFCNLYEVIIEKRIVASLPEIARIKTICRGIFSLFHPRFKILAYHSINPLSRDPFEINVISFEKQLCFLADNGYRVIGLEQAFREFETDNIHEKTVVITFDDGFKTLQRFVFPLLRHFNFPACVFLPFGFIGGIDSFSYEYPRFDRPLLDWDEIQKSQKYGISYGSHTMSHPNLIALDDRVLRYELQESKRILKTRIGTNFSTLAYPFGMFDNRVKKAVQETGYDCALCFGSMLSNTTVTDRFEMKREKILATTTLNDFARLVDVKKDFVRKVGFLAANAFGKA